MDRNKPINPSRSSKSKLGMPHLGGELYALGKSSSRDEASKSKVMASTSKGGPSGISSDRKREASGLPPNVIKKPKLSSSLSVSGSKSLESSSAIQEFWEQIATDCEPVELINSTLTAIEQQDSDTVVGLICGGIKMLLSPRAKPDSVLSLSFLYLAKIRPNLFCNDIITSALVTVLKRDTQHAFKGRNNPTVHVLATNLLARGYNDKKQWPDTFVKLYIDDAINERVWVDNDDCSSFVENICTAFGTKTPPKSMLQPELASLGGGASRDLLGMDEESGDSSSLGDSAKTIDYSLEFIVQPRYAHIQEKAEKLVLDTIKEQLNRRQAPDCSTRNFLKFLSSTSGLAEVRALAVTRLELWIHNGKLNKPAQELLTYICFNVSGQLHRDQEVLSNLVKMRLKTKPLINIYMICLKEMINLQPEILMVLMKYVIQNELSNARNPNNMGMLANMFQAKPEESARYLAEIYQEFLLQREDCLRTLRVFLRELAKVMRYDINLMVFCKSFMQIREELLPQITSFEFKDRFFISMVDLICLSMFLSVSPQIREAIVSVKNGRAEKGSTVLYTFYSQMSEIQCDALSWMYQTVPNVFLPNNTDYTHALSKILMLDSPEVYSKGDQWPPEPERATLLRIVSEVPLHQDTILRIILIGITKEIPFSIPDAMEIVEQVVRRAAGLKNIDYPPLEANKLDIIEFLFNMAEYHHPEKIVLPTGYDPPKLAITALYWKAWNILLMLSAHNPGTFGSYCWSNYSILKNIMELCITNQFTDIRITDDELQVISLEKSQILEFERHLAAATSKAVITEHTSLLLSQLMIMDPMGISRRPPNQMLEQLKTLNGTHKLGLLLCRCRQPDMLVEIIQKYGTSQSLSWLADLVQNSDGDFNHLPVQCLCEFLLSNSNSFNVENVRDIELLAYLQKLVRDESSSHQTCSEVLDYFLKRLSSSSKQNRCLAIKGLRLLLSIFQIKDDETMEIEVGESDWLLLNLPQVPHFPYIRPAIIEALRAACQIENCPNLIMMYIQFIAARTIHDSVSEMLEHVYDISQLIVERATVFSYIIPAPQEVNDNKIQTLNCLFVMVNNFLIKLREQTEAHTYPPYPDLLMVHFPDGTQSAIHLIIIQAFVILLTYSPLIHGAIQMVDYWFPVSFPPPQAFNIETSEPVQILPDWLKLKMIRSPVERLVDVALVGLTPDQIVLFVQNFGTPITSMSKLLALLDRAVIEQFDVVKSTILNTAYLAQLIEIQQSRGAKNGHIAVQALELHGQVAVEPPIVRTSVIETLKMPAIDYASSTTDIKPISKSKEIDDITQVALTTAHLNTMNHNRFRRLIQQLLTKDSDLMKKSKSKFPFGQEYITNKMLGYLQRMIKPPHGSYFIRNVIQSSAVFSLFRALLTNTPERIDNYNNLIQVVDEYIKWLNPTTHRTLIQILINKRKMTIKTPTDVKPSNSSINFLQIFQTAKNFDVEKKGKLLLSELLKKSNTAYLVDSLATVLKSIEVKHDPDLSVSSPQRLFKSDQKGLIVDWLAEIDSELITCNPDIQMDLLFCSSHRQFRFYMLSLLSHQASWPTLHTSISKLLHKFNPSYDATSVLDFIQAVANNPKLWQGRDKAIPKHEAREYVLTFLTESEIHTLVDYILASPANKISSRISFLIKSIDPNCIDLKQLILYVEQHEASHAAKEVFLQNLYTNIPPIKFIHHDLKNVYDANLMDVIGCPADKVIQYVITTITSLSNARDFNLMSDESDFIVRKLAAAHPSLFLRQLPVLAGLLQGRAYMNFFVLRDENHFDLLHQVLGILEILQPQVFEDSYKSGLHNTLQCYFDLLKHHERKETYVIMCLFMDFLLTYMHTNASAALTFIEEYADFIQYLSLNHKKCVSLRQLVQSVTLLKHRSETRKKDEATTSTEQEQDQDFNEFKPTTSTDLKPTTTSVSVFPSTKSYTDHFEWNKLATNLSKQLPADDFVSTLREIEGFTFKRPGFLEDVFEKILDLIFSQNPVSRNIAHNLVVRYLKTNPGNKFLNETVLAAYIKCLQHEDIGITVTAIECLTEIVICLQEYATEILMAVFELGISSKLNTCVQLKRCVAALKTQHAC